VKRSTQAEKEVASMMRENNHSSINLVDEIRKENKKVDSPPIKTKYSES